MRDDLWPLSLGVLRRRIFDLLQRPILLVLKLFHLIFITMIKLKSLITEALDNLYHATDVSNLLKILETNSFKLTYSDSVSSEEKLNRGYPFYLSTSREKYGGYARGRSDRVSQPVIIVIDGKSVERIRDVKIFDVDYWGKSFETPENLRHGETEERIVSKNQTIDNLKRIVQEIHIFCPKRSFDPTISDKSRVSRYIHGIIFPIIEKSKSMNIPTYFYIDGTLKNIEMVFRQLRKNMSMSPTDAKIFFDKILENNSIEKSDEDTKYRRSYFEKDMFYLETLSKIIEHPEDYVDVDYSKNKDIYEIIEYFIRYKRDLVSHFGTIIHNNRKDHPEVFQVLSKSIRRKGYTSFKTALESTSDLLTAVKYIKHTFENKRDDKIKRLKDIINGWELESFDRNKKLNVANYLNSINVENLEKSNIIHIIDLLK